MTKRFWLKSMLLMLTAGTTLLLGWGGCLDATVQRVLVGLTID